MNQIINLLSNNRFSILGNLIIIFILIGFALYIKNAKKIITYIGDHKLGSILFCGVTIFFFILFLYYKGSEHEILKFLYFLNLGLLVIVIISAFIAFKRKDFFMLNYLLLSFFYIEIVCICSYYEQNNLISYITTSMDNKIILEYSANKIIIIESNTNKNNINKIFVFLGLLLLFTVIGWFFYYVVIRDVENKIKNIDKIELKIIFLKSVLQSITAYIALLGLTGLGLGSKFLILILFIDAYAAFSYPILDMNKYIREKEIEQMNDRKHQTAIYFLK